MEFDDIASLEDLKADPYIAQHIIWDFEPNQLLQPGVCSPDAESSRHEITGYLFYIETMNQEPELFLMRHTANGCAETIARIKEVPYDMISGAIAENTDKEFGGMYPINGKIERWLKKELGVNE
jgi:hypothetical protein